MAAKKIRKLGLTKEPDFHYFVDLSGHVSRSPLDEEGRPTPQLDSELVTKAYIEKEPGFVYFVDKDGDIVRERVPDLTGKVELKVRRASDEPTGGASAEPTRPTGTYEKDPEIAARRRQIREQSMPEFDQSAEEMFEEILADSVDEPEASEAQASPGANEPSAKPDRPVIDLQARLEAKEKEAEALAAAGTPGTTTTITRTTITTTKAKEKADKAKAASKEKADKAKAGSKEEEAELNKKEEAKAEEPSPKDDGEDEKQEKAQSKAHGTEADEGTDQEPEAVAEDEDEGPQFEDADDMMAQFEASLKED